MKVTLIADVHANLPALEAVLAHAEAQGANGMILNLGDFVGYGAFPEEVVNRLFEVGAVSVIGNYDQKVLNRKLVESDWARVKKPDKRIAFRFAYEHLSAENRARLMMIPETRRLVLEGTKILMTHASPESIEEFIGPNTPMQRLQELAEMAAADVILCGHTHWCYQKLVGRATFINPGSVGRPDDGDPRASYAVVTFEDGKVEVVFFRVSYDVDAAAAGIRSHKLPELFAEMHIKGRNYNDLLGDR